MSTVEAIPTRPAIPFQESAKVALANSQLRRNMGKATQTIRGKRASVVEEMPDWEALRDAGSAIKNRVLRHLGAYLIQLEEAVTRAGGVVHWARDAREANAIVAAVAQKHGAREVVKVKSLTTDEIGLNEALHAEGIEAIETDLAELIVQLAGDRSSHILVPAIHKNRAEIRELFRQKLGLPNLSDDPKELAGAARTHLRAKFLRAKVAVSGANFGVAETGSICVVESEGNGRMCLTLPDVLVSVMGIEKIIPTWQDLEVFMQLLPRSSTGERMNPYNSFWTGASPNSDGPREFHLILLDNGRTKVLNDSKGRSALHCIRCSACLNICPVYERTGGHAYNSVYPGPIGAILTPQLAGVENAGSLPYASSLCGACYDVCPVKINIPEILIHLRGEVVRQKQDKGGFPGPESVAMKLLAKVFASPALFARSQQFGRLGQKVVQKRGGFIESLPGPLGGWTAMRDVYPVAPQTFREWWKTRKWTSSTPDARAEILARIQSATRDIPAAETPADVPIPRAYRLRDDGPAHERIAAFAERVAEYRATVHRIAAADLPRAIASSCEARGLRRLVVPPDLPEAWIPPGITPLRDDPDRPTPGPFDPGDGVLTGCALGIAQTGTIVLDAGPLQGRRLLTLLPDYHLCVVREDQVVGLLPEAVALLRESASRPDRPITWISGPSATSDIELNRVEGVHGPRTLEVLLVEP